jgi:hypothetical protein
MRTKRKTYKYDSSDYDNGDFGQDDYEGEDDDQEEEDQFGEESEVDSGYDSAGEGGKKNRTGEREGKSGGNHKSRSRPEAEEDESYEDEDPFSPEIDQILADKQIEVPSNAP